MESGMLSFEKQDEGQGQEGEEAESVDQEMADA